MSVNPLIEVHHQADGWGAWDDESKDKKVAYMLQQIGVGRVFSKKCWPGGDKALPTIPIIEKKADVVHKIHVVTRKKKVTGKGSTSVRKQPSKSKRRRSTRNSPAVDTHCPEDIIARLESVEAELAATRSEFSQQLKRLSNYVRRFGSRLKAMKFNCARKLSSHHAYLSSKKKKTVFPPQA